MAQINFYSKEQIDDKLEGIVAPTEEQLAAMNSGITANKVTQYDGYAATIAGKQDALSTAQLAAVNSGVTQTKITQYDGYAATIAGKQDALSTAQLAAVNSGVTQTKITQYDGYAATIAGKQDQISIVLTDNSYYTMTY